jgi:hypothetical protein
LMDEVVTCANRPPAHISRTAVSSKSFFISIGF